MAHDWVTIRNDYINGGGSYRKLAEKYGVRLETLCARGRKEKWVELREKQLHKITTKLSQKTAEKIAKQEADRVARIYAASDELMTRIEQAIRELDQAQVTAKKKTKTVEYKDQRAAGKPTKEVTEETEEIIAVQSIVDRKGLQQVAMALKSVWDMADKDDAGEEIEDDGLMSALDKIAGNLFDDGDDSGMLPEEKDE